MDFKQWMENTDNSNNERAWKQLYDHLLEWHRGVWADLKNWHNTTIQLMRNVGLNNEANDLEMVRISDADIEFGGKPSGTGLGGTIGSVLQHKRDEPSRQRFSAAFHAYSVEIDHIFDVIFAKSEQMGWSDKWDQEYAAWEREQAKNRPPQEPDWE